MNGIDRYVEAIRAYRGRPVKLMEVCGTHTHSIFEHGIQTLLPPDVSLISGPGCPVCVTPDGYIDRAMELARREGWVLCTFGDMVRVPGTHGSLLDAKADGGEVRIMYSPMDVLRWATSEPGNIFCVAAVGFETTLPIYALLTERLLESGLANVRLLTSIKAILPALHWICENTPEIDGFLGPGHVSAIIGSGAYEPLCAKYRIPLAVGGFRYEQVILAIYDLLEQIQSGVCEAHNLYPEAVTRQGNQRAMQLIDRYFIKVTANWRGLGDIEGSGYVLAPAYERFDAGSTLPCPPTQVRNGCLCGQVITGRVSPGDCPYFGVTCTPASPLGPCMVSAEGTCGIWYQNKA